MRNFTYNLFTTAIELTLLKFVVIFEVDNSSSKKLEKINNDLTYQAKKLTGDIKDKAGKVFGIVWY